MNADEIVERMSLPKVGELVECMRVADAGEAYAAFQKLQVASIQSPALLDYVEEFESMLEEKSSYARTRGFLLLAANGGWINGQRMEAAFDRMKSCLHDEKPTVVRQCVQALPDLAATCPYLLARIAAALETVDPGMYRDSMQPLIAADVAAARNAIETIDASGACFAGREGSCPTS